MKPLICLKPVVWVLLAALGTFPLSAQDDVMLKAKRDEMERSRQLKVASTDPPYFLSYGVEMADAISVTASLGALIGFSHNNIKLPGVRLRMGSPAFDNANHVYSDFYSGTRYDPELLPQEDDYPSIRRTFWLATDRAFKTAQEAIGRKRSALKNVNLAEQLPDFSSAEPVQMLQTLKAPKIDENAWKARVVKLSGLFTGYPGILSSGLEFQSIQSANYLLTSEGTAIRIAENLAFLRIRAFTQAPDGMQLRNADVVQTLDTSAFPGEAELRRAITGVADELTALAAAPVGDSYDGPVLFEPRAAAQLFAQVMGDSLKITRKPIGDPGRNVSYLPSELEGKVGSRILPEWMDLVDDPLQKDWRGQPLLGSYEVDSEGVRPKPLNLVQKGVLKSFYLTRTPVRKGFESSNGHARLHGSYGASSPGFGNLFVRASETVTPVELKKKLIEMIKQRNKPYGMLVRKLDYPSGMSVDELRRATTAMAQSGGGTRPVAPPVLVFRVYPDGREELVRGLRFRGVSTRSFRDIAAAGSDNFVFNFLDSQLPFALMGAGGFISNASVVAPAVLFEELELERTQDDLPKLPVVPPPPIGS